MKRTLFVTMVCLWLPMLVRADVRPSLLADHTYGGANNTLELELGWYTDSQLGASLHALSPLVGFRHAFSPSAEIEIDWPFAFVDISTPLGGDSAFVSGNPFLAGYYVDRGEHDYVRVGAGVAPPVVQFDASSLGANVISYSMALAMRGEWDVWLYIPEHLSLAIPIQAETDNDGLVLGADTAIAFLIGTQDGSSSDAVIQLAGFVGARPGVATIGGRLQAVWIPTESQGDNAQLALVPFFQADFEGGGMLYARLTLNLDEPLGLLGDGADVWAVFVGGGAHF